MTTLQEQDFYASFGKKICTGGPDDATANDNDLGVHLAHSLWVFIVFFFTAVY
jgi:hypothetical protein